MYDGMIHQQDPNLITSFELDEQTTAYVVRDVDAPAPDWDGIGYVVRIDLDHERYDCLAIAGDYGDEPLDVAALRQAWDRFRDHELVARYLRAFHDAVSVDYSTSILRDANVYAVVTRLQAAAWGVDLGLWGDLAGQGLEVYRQWVEGECVGIIVTNSETGAEESVWGVYGDEAYWDTLARDIAPIGVVSA